MPGCVLTKTNNKMQKERICNTIFNFFLLLLQVDLSKLVVDL